jgi:hypothetical protein
MERRPSLGPGLLEGGSEVGQTVRQNIDDLLITFKKDSWIKINEGLVDVNTRPPENDLDPIRLL